MDKIGNMSLLDYDLEEFLNNHTDEVIKDLNTLKPEKHGTGINDDLYVDTIDSCIRLIKLNKQKTINSQLLQDIKNERKWHNRIWKWITNRKKKNSPQLLMDNNSH